jgi:hypothetical protein
LGLIVLAAVAYREGWEAVLFQLIFLAICNSAPNPMPQPNFLFLKLHDTPPVAAPGMAIILLPQQLRQLVRASSTASPNLPCKKRNTNLRIDDGRA